MICFCPHVCIHVTLSDLETKADAVAAVNLRIPAYDVRVINLFEPADLR